MERPPVEPPEITFKSILAKTIESLKAVKADGEEPFNIVMIGGMREVNAHTADEIGGELQEMWGSAYPDLFGEDDL